MNLKEALHWGRTVLKGGASPLLDARLLLEYALNRTSIYLLTHLDEHIETSLFEHYKTLIERRSKGEPISKIKGKKEFYGREFFVNHHVLDPRPDSETLVSVVLQRIKNVSQLGRSLEILELGVGTGCLLLTLLAEIPLAHGTGIDISPEALSIAKKNAELFHLSSKVRWIESNMFHNVKGKFDIIICNPPYIPTHEIKNLDPEVKFFEPLRALDGGVSGLDFYQVIASEGLVHLNSPGIMVLEVGYGQMQAVRRLFNTFQTHIFKDINHIDRCILIEG